MGKNDFIQVELEAEKETLKKLGEAAMTVAARDGMAEIAAGVFLYDNKALIEHQKKFPEKHHDTDYSIAPFWIVLQPEGTVSPCGDPMDVEEYFDEVTR